MIRKLRVKFVCYTMLISACMLALLIGTLNYYTHKSIERRRFYMMRRIAEDPGHKFRPQESGSEVLHLSHFTLEYGEDGELDSYGDSSFDLSDQAWLQGLYQRVCALEETYGLLSDCGLHYYRAETPQGPRLVFTDVSEEQVALLHLEKILAAVGFGSFAFLFVLSVLMSGWIVRPVERAWRQQKKFMADISHELKTPLTVIVSNAELLQQPGYDEAQRKGFSDNILTMSRQMRHLVESMLDLARIDNATGNEGREELDFSALVEDCILPFEPLYYEQGLLLETGIEPGLRVQGNRQVLHQCVDILLDNAQKYSEPGTVRVNLRRVGRNAVLTVSNPSPEFSKSECEDVFNRFYRRNEARSEPGSYGLGLPIAEGIVTRYGGKIACTWEAGEIRFAVTLPLI